MPRQVWKSLQRYLETSAANSHTHVHRAGRATTGSIESARKAIGTLVGYNPEIDQVLFTGNGATGAMNFLARVLFPPELRLFLRGNIEAPLATPKDPRGERAMARLKARITRPLVVSSVMEHHSNLLPWIEAVGRENVRAVETDAHGCLDLRHLREIMEKEGDRVTVVSITGTSNVTGLSNDVHAIAKLAHQYGAFMSVDAAQMAPHHQIEMHPNEAGAHLDFVAISGHKMYAPGSRGALIGNVAPVIGARCIGDVGGGMVTAVSMDDFRVADQITAREEAGTPNIPGTVSMGLAAQMLLNVGMGEIADREQKLTKKFLSRLAEVPDIELFGSTDMDKHPRAGVIALNIKGIDDALVATYLDHGWNIAVRNGCFCAHPYVKRLLNVDDAAEAKYLAELDEDDWRHVPGMVRVSLGLYTTSDDLKVLIAALTEIAERRDDLLAAYEQKMDGSYVRKDAEAASILSQRPFNL
jgi:selenocysteine lyase/cysteine desulfurase